MCVVWGQEGKRSGSWAPPQLLSPGPHSLAHTTGDGSQIPGQGQVRMRRMGWEMPRGLSGRSSNALSASWGPGGHEGSRTGHPQTSGSRSQPRQEGTGRRAEPRITAIGGTLPSALQAHPGSVGACPQQAEGGQSEVGSPPGPPLPLTVPVLLKPGALQDGQRGGLLYPQQPE